MKVFIIRLSFELCTVNCIFCSTSAVRKFTLTRVNCMTFKNMLLTMRQVWLGLPHVMSRVEGHSCIDCPLSIHILLVETSSLLNNKILVTILHKCELSRRSLSCAGRLVASTLSETILNRVCGIWLCVGRGVDV